MREPGGNDAEDTRRRLAVLVPLAAYALLAGVLAWRHRDLMNPDAVAYLRNALYLTQGRLLDSVAGTWSPLVSWCVAPFLALGFDPLHALYAVLAVWGALLVGFAALLIRRATSLTPGWTFVALLLIVDATLKWAVTSWPDVILAACLTAAAAALASDRFVERRALQVGCGVWGGLAYLAKSYGLPFFVVFVPLSIAILHGTGGGWRDRERRTRLIRAGLVTLAAAFVVSGPWIAALSWKLGKPTIGTAGAINHAIVGPADDPRDALWVPVEGRVTVWEIPETRRYLYWSPFDGPEAFAHQVRHTWGTAKKIRDAVARFDYLALSLGLVAIAPFFAAAAGDRRGAARSAWFLATAVAFCAPLALVNFEYRYVTPWLKPVLAIACLHAAQALGARLSAIGRRGLGLVVVASFAAHLNVPFRPYTYPNADGTPFDDVVVDTRLHRAVARTLLDAGHAGPLASTRYWGGIFVGYFMDRPFVGTPAGRTADACKEEMASVGVRTFLMDPDWRFAAELLADPEWTEAGSVDVGGGRRMTVVNRKPRAP